jgi:hypothetical protein
MMGAPDGIRTRWRKSSYSSDSFNCIEVALSPVQVMVRDSKDAGGPTLSYAAASWEAFVTAVRTDVFDQPSTP